MSRLAFKIGPINIYWYSLMIALGFLVAFVISLKEIKKHKIDETFFGNLVFYVVLFGILGARIYYVLFNLDYYLVNPTEIIKIWNGGLAIHGGIIAGLIVIIIYTRKYRINTLKILDISVVGVIIAQAIGRWGNFFNQEAFGQVTSREILSSQNIPNFIIDGMYIDGNYYQPTFLYESVWNAIGFIIMLFIRRKKSTKVGELTGFYLIWYSIGRIFIESFRSDSLMLGNIRIAQLISIILIVIGIFIIARSLKKKELYN